MNRFAGFNTEEIGVLLQGLLFDDGLEYVPEPGSVEERLVAELRAVPDCGTNLYPPRLSPAVEAACGILAGPDPSAESQPESLVQSAIAALALAMRNGHPDDGSDCDHAVWLDAKRAVAEALGQQEHR